MKRNLLRTLTRRAATSRGAILKCMLDELSGDHAQSLQLATSAQRILQLEGKTSVDTLLIIYDAALVKVKLDKDLGIEFAKGALPNVGFDSALMELNDIVQNIMMTAASKMYGHFCSPNSPIISNSTVVYLVETYMELVPVHHAAILTMLNVDKKIRDKRYHYMLKQYERLHSGCFCQ